MTNIESDLNVAEAEVESWRSHIARIHERIAENQAVLDKSEARRAEHALAAAMRDGKASAAMLKIRRDDDTATKNIADLRLALPEAHGRLAAAEMKERAARLVVNEARAKVLRRKRIESAKRLDAASKELDAAYQEFRELGEELQTSHHEMLEARGYEHATSGDARERLTGIQRIIAALPSMFRVLFPTASIPPDQVPLASAEAAFWQMPVDEDESSAAA